MRILAITTFFAALLLGFFALACFLPTQVEIRLQREIDHLSVDEPNAAVIGINRAEIVSISQARRAMGVRFLVSALAIATAAAWFLRRTLLHPQRPEYSEAIVLPRIDKTALLKPFGFGIVQKRFRLGAARSAVRSKLEPVIRQGCPDELHV